MTSFYDWMDDKALVIIGLVVIALCALWRVDSPETIITGIVSGLAGLATGAALGGKGEQ